jgi:hypothetical protein
MTVEEGAKERREVRIRRLWYGQGISQRLKTSTSIQFPRFIHLRPDLYQYYISIHNI